MGEHHHDGACRRPVARRHRRKSHVVRQGSAATAEGIQVAAREGAEGGVTAEVPSRRDFARFAGMRLSRPEHVFDRVW